MNITDVDVIISVSGQSGSAGTWYPLIYVKGENSATTYKEYSELTEIVSDYATTTNAYKVANLLFMQDETFRPEKIAIAEGSDDVLASLTLYMDKDWRQLIVIGEYDSTVAQGIETTEKQYFTHFTTVSALKSANITSYDRTVAIVYTADDVVNAEAAIVGRMAGLVAGAGTYHAKVVKGVTAENFTKTELDEIHEAGGFAYVMKNGRVATSNGICGSGEYVDVIESKDYVIQNVRYDVQEVFLNNNKIPYTDEGITKVENAVRNVLAKAANNGMIATDENGQPLYSTNFAPRSATSAQDRATREYNYGTFEFELAGAIHKAKIKGAVTA